MARASGAFSHMIQDGALVEKRVLEVSHEFSATFPIISLPRFPSPPPNFPLFLLHLPSFPPHVPAHWAHFSVENGNSQRVEMDATALPPG